MAATSPNRKCQLLNIRFDSKIITQSCSFMPIELGAHWAAIYTALSADVICQFYCCFPPTYGGEVALLNRVCNEINLVLK